MCRYVPNARSLALGLGFLLTLVPHKTPAEGRFETVVSADDPALREDEDPLEPGELDLALAPAVEPEMLDVVVLEVAELLVVEDAGKSDEALQQNDDAKDDEQS